MTAKRATARAGCGGLASLYSKGEGVRRDTRKAEQMFHRACKAGDARACSGLGHQRRIAGNAASAAPMFSRACRLGYARACFYEGRMLLKSKMHNGQALPSFKRACRGNDQRGCLSAAFLLDGKPGVKVDRRAAARYRGSAVAVLKRRCERSSNARACETLGDYFKGKYGRRSMSRVDAARYYRMACAQGRKAACSKR